VVKNFAVTKKTEHCNLTQSISHVLILPQKGASTTVNGVTVCPCKETLTTIQYMNV